mmetsp:Transcript_36895/g.82959  ORF Transcript_36895/g.82959 Transcript_36895/m.82959 type:complete len:381 (+) Transcript_36895:437-1579(+)
MMENPTTVCLVNTVIQWICTAGLVEETVKFVTLYRLVPTLAPVTELRRSGSSVKRCCEGLYRLGPHPYTIALCSLASAGGFATMENFEYIFLGSAEPGTIALSGIARLFSASFHLACTGTAGALYARLVYRRGWDGMLYAWAFCVPVAAVLHGLFDAFLSASAWYQDPSFAVVSLASWALIVAVAIVLWATVLRATKNAYEQQLQCAVQLPAGLSVGRVRQPVEIRAALDPHSPILRVLSEGEVRLTSARQVLVGNHNLAKLVVFVDQPVTGWMAVDGVELSFPSQVQTTVQCVVRQHRGLLSHAVGTIPGDAVVEVCSNIEWTWDAAGVQVARVQVASPRGWVSAALLRSLHLEQNLGTVSPAFSPDVLDGSIELPEMS